MTKKQIGNLNRFEYDLGQNWKLIQLVDGEGIELMRFTNGSERIDLNNDSVKKLRAIFNKQK